MNNYVTMTQNISTVIAVIALGIMAGFFWTYSFNVNIAMLQVNGETYATMQSLFNQNVRHAMFFSFFFGAGVITAIAALLHIKHTQRSCFYLLLLAAVVYIVGIIVFTAKVNLPLNYYTESWNPNNLPADWNETRLAWNHANMLRVVTSFIAFVLSTVALSIKK